MIISMPIYVVANDIISFLWLNSNRILFFMLGLLIMVYFIYIERYRMRIEYDIYVPTPIVNSSYPSPYFFLNLFSFYINKIFPIQLKPQSIILPSLHFQISSLSWSSCITFLHMFLGVCAYEWISTLFYICVLKLCVVASERVWPQSMYVLL